MKKFVEVFSKIIRVVYISLFSFNVIIGLLFIYERTIGRDAEKSLLQKLNISLTTNQLIHIEFFFFVIAIALYQWRPFLLENLKNLEKEQNKKKEKSFLSVSLSIISAVLFWLASALMLFVLYQETFGVTSAEKILQKLNISLNLNQICVLLLVVFILYILCFDIRKKLSKQTKEENKGPTKSYIEDDEE